MNAHNLGPLIWVILVMFGVVSSIVRSARRASTQQPQQPPQPQQPKTRQQPQPQQPQRRSTQPRAVREFMPAPGAAPQRPVPGPASTPLPPWLATALQTVAEQAPPPKPTPAPVTPPPVVPRAVTPPAAAPLPPQRPQRVPHLRPQAGVLQGMFEDRDGLVRAIVAAEVLGPPIALREQSIWSPLHNEPSI